MTAVASNPRGTVTVEADEFGLLVGLSVADIELSNVRELRAQVLQLTAQAASNARRECAERLQAQGLSSRTVARLQAPGRSAPPALGPKPGIARRFTNPRKWMVQI